ncbi:rac GTPase-activating protein 1-like [Mauremys mutica]|uniref:rac GTPase-activating protein 1-like n=1 Tax=Mauremys mutica TaxID=74926 RepID=UPI001D15AB92|nr:rac GTPase-activating protein 1-like [Mauremys mutica]
METAMLNLRNLFDQLMRQSEFLNEGNEYQFIQLAKNFEEFRKKWQKADHELARYKDLLMKTETERSALDVKLKHARNQVDVEIKRRQQAETDCEKLERRIQLIRELLMCDASGSIHLSEEQKSALAFRPQLSTGDSGNRRLSTIDESGSILSDISFDKTDESLTGLYRISGCDRTVKELKEKFLRGKTVPLLSKVDDIHAICGLLKDFLCSLKEPILTFRLNKTFMEAAEILDEDNSVAAMYEAVGELPQANRDTLAFLMIHLQRVAQSPDTKMDITNLSKVFGPTIVAHAVPDPDPMTLLQDTKRQPKVVERLLSLPVEYWSQFMMVEQEDIDPAHVIENSNAYSTPRTPDVKVSMLGPLTTPEQQLTKTPSSSSLSQKVRSTLSKTTPKFGSKSKSATNLGRQGYFFASPMLK